MTDLSKYYNCSKCWKIKQSLQMHRRKESWWVCKNCAEKAINIKRKLYL